jgi:PAS domain S-box-containing protein
MVRNMSGAQEAELAKLENEYRQLQEQVNAQAWELNLLRARFARYETALRGSQVTVYTQDRDLRYTSISNPMLGRAIEDILGRTDAEILSPEAGAAMIAVKRAVLASGEAKRAEVPLEDAPGIRWHDLHIEPLRNEVGDVVGLTCASVDVTERKEGEAHLRLLLRELRSQLGVYLDGQAAQVSIEGPAIAIKPEAAQNLGLALHELAVNAAKYGALSVPVGRVVITWNRLENVDGSAVELDWREKLGPKVKARRRKGFGSMVIERNLARALDATVELEFDPDGLHCHIVIPANQILALR